MNLVNDIDQYQSLVAAIKMRQRNLLTNCYLMLDDVANLVHQKSLFWEMDDTGLIFLNEEKYFYQVYFFVTEEYRRTFTVSEKPFIINLVHKGGDQVNKVKTQMAIWKENGFDLYRTYRRMVRKNDAIMVNSNNQASVERKGYLIKIVEITQVDELLGLWTRVLDLFSNALPARQKIVEKIDQKRFYCVLDRCGKMVAAVDCMRYDNKECIIQHLAVEEEHRHRGLARGLVQTCLQICGNVDRFILWVAENNQPAIHLYLEQGFEFDQLMSIQLMKK